MRGTICCRNQTFSKRSRLDLPAWYLLSIDPFRCKISFLSYLYIIIYLTFTDRTTSMARLTRTLGNSFTAAQWEDAAEVTRRAISEAP